MKIFKLKNQDKLSDFDYLEQIYKKVCLGEIVKFNGRAYVRVTPKNNKYYKNSYHFNLLTDDIYSGDVLIEDDDGELVRTRCHYKIEIIE